MAHDNRQNNNKNRNNNNRQRTPRYTGKNVDPMGDVGRMGKYAITLFRDMAYGKFKANDNSVNNLSVFQNQEFVWAAIQEVSRKIQEQNTYITALNYTYGYSEDLVVYTLKDQHQRALSGWSMILQVLYAILNSGDYSLVYGLMNKLPDYRYVLH